MQKRNAHLATWLAVYPSSQQSYALRRQARRRDESSGEFSGKACDVLPTLNSSVESICLRPCRHFAEATRATVDCVES